MFNACCIWKWLFYRGPSSHSMNWQMATIGGPPYVRFWWCLSDLGTVLILLCLLLAAEGLQVFHRCCYSLSFFFVVVVFIFFIALVTTILNFSTVVSVNQNVRFLLRFSSYKHIIYMFININIYIFCTFTERSHFVCNWNWKIASMS